VRTGRGNDGVGELPHARDSVDEWVERWSRTGRIVLLLDFDGTLAPIVSRPEAAEMSPETRAALDRLLASPGVQAAVISGRGAADARARARLGEIAYAGNHGMEIYGPGLHQVHPEAAAARPTLEAIRDRIDKAISGIPGAFVEDKGLTLSVHFRLAAHEDLPAVERAVEEAVARMPEVRVTEGKKILEVRPRVDWHKGKAVEFLLDHFDPGPDVPVLYLGDDVTDEDAFKLFRETGRGAGILVTDSPPAVTAAAAYVRDPAEVAELLGALASRAPA
jgi:trehalose 6-phosphate phosphatase